MNITGSYAHFPGTGPKGTKCFTCNFLIKSKSLKNKKYPSGTKDSICRKWIIITKKSEKEALPIISDSESCKFYEERGP
jgi:hypothetical protein